MTSKKSKSRAGRPTSVPPKSGPSYRLAEWLRDNLDSRLKITQTELADRLGYERQTMISMMKMGHTRVPIDIVEPLAKELEVDVDFLLILAMEQYLPDGENELKRALGKAVLENEFALVDQLRPVIPTRPVKLNATQLGLIGEILSATASAD